MRFLVGCFSLVLILPGCASVSEQDGTAIIQAAQALRQEHENMASAFATITSRSIGDTARKDLILTRIEQSRARMQALTNQLSSTVASMMEVDYEALYAQLRETYDQLRPTFEGLIGSSNTDGE